MQAFRTDEPKLRCGTNHCKRCYTELPKVERTGKMGESKSSPKSSKRGSPESVKRASPSSTAGSLTVRLAEKTRYGLDLLARAQHRSLSQAVEWSMSVGLNSYDLDADLSLGKLLDELWLLENDAARAIKLFSEQPILLSFEQRAACELAYNSEETELLATGALAVERKARKLRIYTRQRLPSTALPEERDDLANQIILAEKELELAESMRKKYRELFDNFVITNWDSIIREATALHEAGKSLRNHVLVDIIGIPRDDHARNPFIGLTSPHFAGQMKTYVEEGKK